MKFKVGDTVQQIVKPIVGEVLDMRWNHAEGDMEVLVKYADQDGDHERWFLVGQMEVKQ